MGKRKYLFKDRAEAETMYRLADQRLSILEFAYTRSPDMIREAWSSDGERYVTRLYKRKYDYDYVVLIRFEKDGRECIAFIGTLEQWVIVTRERRGMATTDDPYWADQSDNAEDLARVRRLEILATA